MVAVAKTKKNGASSGHSVAPMAMTDTGPRVALAPLQDMEQAEVRVLHRAVTEAKVTLANMTCQIAKAEEQRQRLVHEVLRADESLVARITAMAAQRGLPADGWTFDVSTMQFSNPLHQ